MAGDAYDNLFYNMMLYAEVLWTQMNANDPEHVDANKRARSMMPKDLRKYTYRDIKY